MILMLSDIRTLLMDPILLCFCVSEAEVEKHLQDISGKEGQSCTLSCQLSIPNVEAQWLKNGKQLEMKGRYTSEVKHKVQKLLIRDLNTEDQGRYTCRYQHLESSADLWVEGLYLETILQPSKRAGCSSRLLTSFDFPHQTLRLMLEFWILPSFFSFLWDLCSSVLTFFMSLLSWIILQKHSPSFYLLSSYVCLDSNPSSPETISHHNSSDHHF